MNKKLLLGLILLGGSVSMMADDYKYLTVTTGSAKESISLPTIQKISFTKTDVLVTTSNGTYTYPLTELQKMVFEDTASDIQNMPEQAEGLKFIDGQLSVTGSGLLCIYRANGTLVQMAKIQNGANINLYGLKNGIYIVKMGEKVIKIQK